MIFEKCEYCNGKGRLESDPKVKCHKCNGFGYFSDEVEIKSIQMSDPTTDPVIAGFIDDLIDPNEVC